MNTKKHLNIGIIGKGAIARYVARELAGRGHRLAALLLRPESLGAQVSEMQGVEQFASAADLPDDLDLVVDCAGHQGLRAHGPDILQRGFDLLTVSIGALTDAGLHETLEQAAEAGDSRLLLASGAMGGLDCLLAARVGNITEVSYTGTKPPLSWKGTPAEFGFDLDKLKRRSILFEGPARMAAREYPKNANVAAAVALAGVGFDETRVRLIADPDVTLNTHQVLAHGEFGTFAVEIRGRALPDNPRSSALAAMSVIGRLEQETRRIRF